jgi:hypothetical protein
MKFLYAWHFITCGAVDQYVHPVGECQHFIVYTRAAGGHFPSIKHLPLAVQRISYLCLVPSILRELSLSFIAAFYSWLISIHLLVCFTPYFCQNSPLILIISAK